MGPPRAPAPAPGTPAPGPGPGGRALLLGAVFLTGATSLAYEVAWSRGLVLLLGSTATTAALVLGVFVAGLGLGARWGGGLAHGHRRPLVLYGLLEVAAAAWAVGTLGAGGILEGPYVAAAAHVPGALRLLLRVLAAALVVLPGAFLLGATLPALVREWVRATGEGGRGTAWVYGTNTAGAVLGCLFAGFVGIEAWGVGGLMLAAGALAATVGVVAVLAGARLAPRPVVAGPTPPPGPRAVGGGWEVLLVPALCGLVGLGVEIAGFRILVFFLEGFSVTFAAMLGVFIAGLGLGSLLLGPALARSERPDRALGVLLAAAGIVLLLELWLVVPRLETWMREVKAWSYGGAADVAAVARGLRAASVAGAAALLLLPGFWLGATFPLCVRWAEVRGAPPARAVGRAYAYNSLGTLAAPLLVGFVAIPALGVPRAWTGLGVLALALGLALLLRGRAGGARRATAWALVVPVTLGLAVLGPPAEDLVAASHVLQRRPGRRLRAVATDAVTTASVVEGADGETILYTDDFAAAATGRHYRYMRMLGHLPVLLAPRPEHVMVIAFGTGTTAGAVAAHDERTVRRLEVVEVSRAVLDLAPWFLEANRSVLRDGRVVVHQDDGRSTLLLHAPDLDVITLEPLMPYTPQGLPFYTREFYELARSRLREGGVLCQWLPVHAMPPGLYAAFVRTFFEVFPDGTLWFFEQSTALIGHRGGERVDRDALAARMDTVAADLETAGLGRPDLLLAACVSDGATVRASLVPDSPWTGAGGRAVRTVRDLDPFPEFHPTPRAGLARQPFYLPDTLAYLASLVPDGGGLGGAVGGVEPEEARQLAHGTRLALAARRFDGNAEAIEILRRGLVGDPRASLALAEEALRDWRRAALLYEEALASLPGDATLTWRRARATRRATRLEVLGYFALARRARAEGREEEAEERLATALSRAAAAAGEEDGDPVASERAEALLLHAAALLRLGRCEAAAEVLRAGAAAFPPGADRGRLEAAQEGVEARRRGEDAAPDAGVGPWLGEGAPPCRREGTAPVIGPLLHWESLVEAGTPRALRLAADSLVAAAREEDVVEAVLEHLRAGEAPRRPEARAVRAGLLAALDPADATLGDLLASEEEAERAQAAAEAGRHRRLRDHLDRARTLAADPSPRVRRALAEAAGMDEASALLALAADLLVDEDRGVRLAAVGALYRRFPDLLAEYDPDGPPSLRREVAARIRERLR